MRNKPFSRRVSSIVIMATGALVAAPLLVAQPAFAATTANLVKNAGAEAGTAGTGEVVAVPDWIESTGASFTAVKYGASGFPSKTSPGPNKRGHNFFAGGPDDANNDIVATQTIPLGSFKAAIKNGGVTFSLSTFLGGVGSDPDQALVELDFKDKNGFLTGSSTTLPAVTASDRGNVTGLLKRSAVDTVPTTARSIYLQLIFERIDGTYNNALADKVVVTLSGV